MYAAAPRLTIAKNACNFILGILYESFLTWQLYENIDMAIQIIITVEILNE
jgi:hypothetical protein